MKVHIENLGAVKTADIEVGDLTIIAGQNSTGKTNLVYTIYDVIKNTQNYFKFVPTMEHYNEIDKILKELQDAPDMLISIPTPKIFQELPERKQKVSGIKSYLGSKLLKEIHDDFVIKVDEDTLTYNFSADLRSVVEVHTSIMEFIEEMDATVNIIVPCLLFLRISLNKNEKHTAIELNSMMLEDKITYDKNLYDDEHKTIINNFLDKYEKLTEKDNFEVDDMYCHKAFISAINNILESKAKIEIATSDRSGIISFLSENQKKLRQVTREAFLDNDNSLLSRMIYTKPTQDNIDFLNSLPDLINIRKRNTKIENEENLKENYHLKEVYKEIEKLIGGTLHMTQMGEVYFTMFDSKTEEESLKFVELSSSIKNLTMIYFQLKYSETFATIDENTYYVIDEPEAFLHPMNQIKMARVLAMLVNHGVKVIVTTHSEYLIRELNVLIALGSNDIQPENYKGFSVLNDVKETMTLNVNKKDVNIYTLNLDGTTEKQIVNPKGMAFHGFDSALESQAKSLGALKELAKKVKQIDSEDNLKGKE